MAIYNTPIPGASDYAASANTAKLAYDQAVAQIGQKRSTLLRQYGYNAQFDPNSGAMSGLSVDPGNPFGALQSMLHNQANQDQQAEWGAEDRGLHGGLANQAETDLRYQHGAESSQLGQSLLGGINDLQNQFTGAGTDYHNALYQAELDAAQNAIGNGDYNPGDYNGLDAVPYGDQTGAPTTPYSSPAKSGAVAKASAAAMARTKGGAAASALAARSAGMNAAYNLPKTAKAVVAKKMTNAYNTNKNKRG